MSQSSTDNATSIELPQLLKQLLRILPKDSVLHQTEDLRPYECDGLSVYRQLGTWKKIIIQ